MATVEFIIPLLPIDRWAVDRLREILPSFDLPESLAVVDRPSEVFPLWSWTREVTENLREHLDGESFDVEHDQNRHMAYAGTLNALCCIHHDSLTADQFRVDVMKAANPSFLDALGDSPTCNVKCVPDARDAPSWALLAHLHLHGKLPFRRVTILEREKVFDIWESVQMLFLQSSNLGNDCQMYPKVLCHPCFASLYKLDSEPSSMVEGSPAATDTSQIEEQQHGDDAEGENEADMLELIRQLSYGDNEIPATGFQEPHDELETCKKERQLTYSSDDEDFAFQLQKKGADQRKSNNIIMTLLKQLGAQEATRAENPCRYLHIIPWTQLVPMPMHEAKEIIAANDPFGDIFQSMEAIDGLLWTPPDETFKWMHHLRTEDEVLQYCIANNWPLPGHFYHDSKSVVLIQRPIEDTCFFSQIRSFWERWNDCSVTVRPEDERVFLLETVPGRQYRSRIEHQDVQAALKYFRNLVEAHCVGTLNQRAAEETLGQGNALPYFDKSLCIIPAAQVLGLSARPIGRGANGAVWEAVWHRPPGALATTNAAAAQVPVVLKEVLSNSSDGQSLRKLLRELNLTYLALAGSSVGCVEFMGLTNLDGYQEIAGAGARNRRDKRLLLVFEKATQGSLLEYLDRVLPGQAFMQAWDTIIAFVSNVANGLDTLHARGIIHRDLHPNNVLVLRTQYTDGAEDHAVVTDIGEGKRLDDRVAEVAGACYGRAEFRAPEVRGARGWSAAADVFALGVLCGKILEVQAAAMKIDSAASAPVLARRLARDGPADADIAPSGLRDLVMECLARDPAARPGAHDAARRLDTLAGDFMYKKDVCASQAARRAPPDAFVAQVEWCRWNWRQALTAATRGGSEVRPAEGYSSGDSITGTD